MIMDLHGTVLAKILHGIDTVIHRIMLYVAEIALLVMVCIVTANVFVRLFIPSMGGFAWIEEVAFILIGLFTFLACSMGVRDRFHIGIAILYNRFGVGSTGRRVLDIISKVATFAVGAILLYFGIQLCQKLGRFTITNTKWPRWTQYMGMPFGGAVMMFDSLLQLFGIVQDNDLLYSEPEVEYEVEHEKK